MKTMMRITAIVALFALAACGQEQQTDTSASATSASSSKSAPLYVPHQLAGAFLDLTTGKQLIFMLDFTPGSAKPVPVEYGVDSTSEHSTKATPVDCDRKVRAGWKCTYKEANGLFTAVVALTDAASGEFRIESIANANGPAPDGAFHSQMVPDGDGGNVSCDSRSYTGLCDFGRF